MVFKKINGGPGCGKTYYLKGVYQDLLKTGYKPEDITVLTFRKNAAEDLINAIKPYTNLDAKEVKEHVGTIHAICYRLLGKPLVINEENRTLFQELHKYNFKSSGKDAEEKSHSGNPFDLYTWLLNTCTPFDQWRKYPGWDKIQLPADQVPDFFMFYKAFKEAVRIIDYSDMLQHVIDNKVPLDTPVLIVDEFQDLTAQMFKVFEMWVPQCEHVYIAGDPNQSIYGFWGGSPDYFNKWEAEEIILGETFRLREPIKNYSHDHLRCNKMTAPEMRAVKAESQVIFRVPYDSVLPSFSSELHLIRCNYQASPIAMKLANEGKVFSAPVFGWKDKEIDAANAIIRIRTEQQPIPAENKALINLYSNFNKEKIISGNIFDGMISNNKLLRAKLYGIMNRTSLITQEEVQNRRIMTIHGAKGLEADAVFLHLGITTEIRKAILMPGEEQRAEARVWYVGITRAKKVLYLVEDRNHNYLLIDERNYVTI